MMILMKKNSKLRQTLRVFVARGIVSKVALVIVILFFAVALFAPLLTPYNPTDNSLLDRFQGPSAKHWFGTDGLGRDILTRVLFGARVSMLASFGSSLLAACIGILLGLSAGYFGKFYGAMIMRITDAMLSIPPMILILTIAMFFTNGIVGVVISVGISLMPTYIRMVYGLVLSIRENDYIVASKLIGQSGTNILLKHLLPNCVPTIIVMFTMNLGTAIMLESTLSYLGIGIKPPIATWGGMVSEGFQYIQRAPHAAIIPGVCMILVIIAFNIVGDSLRDALDPKLRGKL